MRCHGTASLLCCLTLALPLQAATTPDSFFDYLYIEASSGSSAGGHAAVRFGDEVYHFQHDSPGIISAAVQSWSSFDLDYRGLSNRPIHVLRVDLPSDARGRLRDAFHRQHVVQSTQLALLDSAQRDVELLGCLEHGALNEECGVKLDGAGYFFASDSQSPESPTGTGLFQRATAAIDDLRAYMGRDDTDAIERRRQELGRRIVHLRPRQRVAPRLEEGRVAPLPRGFADEYADLLLEWLALDVIHGRALPIWSAFRKCPGELTTPERETLAAREAYQRKIVLELLTSSRPDRGYALMVSLARLVALRASRDSGELYVVDTYAAGAREVSLERFGDHADSLRAALREREEEMRAARAAALSAQPSDELRWSRFEVVANVALELERALAGYAFRVQSHDLSPLRGASPRRDWPSPRLSSETRAVAFAGAVELKEKITQRLRALYRYDLLRRNCVTEIFRTLNEASAGGVLQRIDIGTSANFIPFVSAAAVKNSYPLTEEFVLPSYRQLALRRMLDASDSWTTRLREETSLTATLVPIDVNDEVFLFYSSDTVALRPILGAANLAFGFAGMVAGVFSAPIDGATLLRAAARGVFYSAPELVFVNIRKGTVPLLPSDWEDLTPPAPLPEAGRGEGKGRGDGRTYLAAGAASAASPAVSAVSAPAPPPM